MAELLVLSKDLRLPLAAVTERLGFLGRTGSGKTYAAQKLAEEMYRAGAQFIVLDPVGVWHGLRLAADGKGAGLPIPVLGGLHGDIPLEATGGALIANLVVDRGVSVVLDVSQFESDADKARFAQAFADRFFFRKKASPSAVHLFIEEAQEFVPQNPQREEARMLHAFTRLVKIGRNFGIGVSLISQRPQEVNKKVLNLTELLFCFQLTGPQERKTIQGWIAEKGIDEDIAAELPKLDVGQPHVWSPAWLKISERVRIAPKKTLDVSATPIVGQRTAARDLSPIDLEGLRKEMAATIERAKAEDPKALRAELATVKAELARVKAAPSAVAPERIEVPVLTDAQVARLEQAIAEVRVHHASGRETLEALLALGDLMATAIRTKMLPPPRAFTPPAAARQVTPAPQVPRASARRPSDLEAGEQRILDTIAMLNVRGIPLSREAVARWMGIHPNGGRYNRHLAALRAAGHLDGLMLMASGASASQELPTGWDATLAACQSDGQRRILTAASERSLSDRARGVGLSREELARALGIHPNGGRFNRDLAWLRTMGVIPERGAIVVLETATR